MSKLAFSPRTAVHAIRGLALGTSCSLILISEERLKRLELARTVVDNGRLLKSQRCYNPGGAVAVMAELEHTHTNVSFTGADVPVGLGLDGLATRGRSQDGGNRETSSPPPRRRSVRLPPFLDEGSFDKVQFPLRERGDRVARIPSVTITRQKWSREPSPRRAAILQEIAQFQDQISTAPTSPEVPEPVLEQAKHLLTKLEQNNDLNGAQHVLDALCRYSAIDHRDLAAIDAKFVLRGLLHSTYADKRRPGRRFRLAVFTFWDKYKAAQPEEKAALLELLAEEFARDTTGHSMQSFLATSHLQFGRHMTAKILVSIIAKLYRAHGHAKVLALWLDRAEKAGAPIHASSPGRALMREWETEDSAKDLEPTLKPQGNTPVIRLKEDIRRPLETVTRQLDEAQLQVFTDMWEAAEGNGWQQVLDIYSRSLEAGLEVSDACLRLAVEASIELEGIHSPKALRLIEQAHRNSLDVDPIIQTLLLARFDAIGEQQAATQSRATKGEAYRAIQSLLSTVQPIYSRPSELVYNRAIRVCLRHSELKQTRELCLQLAAEHWNGDALFKVYNFASLVTVAVRSKDYSLFQRLLEALPWRPYQGHPICKTTLREARVWIQRWADMAPSPEERRRHEDALGYVEIAYQSVLQVRSSAHRQFRAGLKTEAFAALTPGHDLGNRANRGNKLYRKGSQAATSASSDGDATIEHNGCPVF
ncbi:hypothetical protein jhhlp_003555 [Lomentospora prolificans]|uniref:Uncharacterized protein n=1 Tax=Lomentospora prolificans TaxID=41688 RepID=A0A2N3N989_9PEZI|nr:hypothetical protein jhhlp_003555 [Lomentospora prolificans]